MPNYATSSKKPGVIRQRKNRYVVTYEDPQDPLMETTFAVKAATMTEAVMKVIDFIDQIHLHPYHHKYVLTPRLSVQKAHYTIK